MAIVGAAFRYYRPTGFGGPRGRRVEFISTADAAPGAPPAVAQRTSGLLDGGSITAEPLDPLPCSPASPPTASTTPTETEGSGRCYYFEIEVREMVQRSIITTKTLSIGFVWLPRWPSPPASCADHASSSSIFASPGASTVSVPELVGQMPRSIVIGGDLPRASFGGQELRKVTGWRPLLELQVGTTVGALLEEVGREPGLHRLTIFQDGVRRCHAEANVPPEWGCGAVIHGVVDVCGTVQAVQLRQAAEPPITAAPLASTTPQSSGLSSCEQQSPNRGMAWL